MPQDASWYTGLLVQNVLLIRRANRGWLGWLVTAKQCVVG